MPPITPGTPLHSLADAFRQSFSAVLSQTLASPWTVEIDSENGAASPEDGPPLCFGLSPSGGLRGDAAFQLLNSDARSLGQKLLKEPADASSELNSEHKQAIESLLRMVAEQTTVTLKALVGEVALQVSSMDAPSWPGVTVRLAASSGPAGQFSVHLRFSDELVAALPSPVADVPERVSIEPATGDSQLDLLLGVDLNLTLRFGQRASTLGEVLDLSSGSVVELDRRVQEPAELLLGDKLIARGEVVIVDSRYGIRITEVCDPQHPAAERASAAG